jgi:hypothetical protein
LATDPKLLSTCFSIDPKVFRGGDSWGQVGKGSGRRETLGEVEKKLGKVGTSRAEWGKVKKFEERLGKVCISGERWGSVGKVGVGGER